MLINIKQKNDSKAFDMSGMEIGNQTDKEKEQVVRQVYCLSIDLVGSTEAGLRLSTSQLDSFNSALVDQINPHLRKLGLLETLIKFTGDGWLVMTDSVDKVSALCCLSIIMSSRFQYEMSQLSAISIAKIPSLRLSICSGRDVKIKLPNGHNDWVGDSARRATRASGYCLGNEILIDEPTRYAVLRDFHIHSSKIDERSPELQPKKNEESFTLSILGELKPEIISDSSAAEHFLYTLNIIGKQKEAAKLLRKVSKRLTSDRNGVEDNLEYWNRLLTCLPDYSSSLEFFNGIKKAKLHPDVCLYNTLISKAPDYNTANSLVKNMLKEGVQPDVDTNNMLTSKAPDYKTAELSIKKMCRLGVQPDADTYNKLISKARDFQKAEATIEKMQKGGVQPTVDTYNTLISKAPDHKTAAALIKVMVSKRTQPNLDTFKNLISKMPFEEGRVVISQLRSRERINPDIGI